ncbi:homoserine dehydrogenase [bacterium]|nr:homoserine dehydrogenase [bacterium]
MIGKIGIGLLGYGNVGVGLVKLLEQSQEVVFSRTGLTFEVIGALVRDPQKPREVALPFLTDDPAEIYLHSKVDIVVEILGGIEPATTYLLEALKHGKHVVTANKAVLAENGSEIYGKAHSLKRRVGIEAAVCGGIPVIKALNQGLVANRINGIDGIMNGTTNYILSQMHRSDVSYQEALTQAQNAGFAEPDPALDVNGSDTAQKLSILARFAFGVDLPWKLIPRHGIEQISSADIHFARKIGYVIRLIGSGHRNGSGIDFRVTPALIPERHPLAHVQDEYNAITIRGDAVDNQMLYGKGAGAFPTASALLADMVDVATGGGIGIGQLNGIEPAQLTTLPTRYYLRFPIPDKPGAIGKLAMHLGEQKISIRNASAELSGSASNVGQVQIVTHQTYPSQIEKAFDKIIEDGLLLGDPVGFPILNPS